MTRVLVTGAAGYLGRALVAELAGRDAEVVPLVRRLDERAPTDARACELGDAAAIAGLFEELRPDAVVHAAARISAARTASADDVAALLADNVTATAALAATAARAGVRRFVFCSSVEVYGAAPANGIASAEGDALAPAGIYGESKLAGEAVLRMAAASGMEVALLRMPGIHGAPRASGIVHAFLDAARKGATLRAGEPDTVLSLLFLADAVRVIADLADRPLGRPVETLNLANGNIRLGDLADLAVAVCGSASSVDRGTGEPRNRALDLSRLAAFLGAPLPTIAERLSDEAAHL